ncbi:MAG: hypothetical protein M3Q22_01710 [Actinomycetota bacterium]|nr:hypothetical protein [Actinomycetota bacterium]
MARRKVAPPAARSSTGRDAPPPLEVLRCPATRWDAGPTPAAAFEEWLRERQAWRESHDAPLPGLFARDRYALHRMDDRGELDRAVVAAELAAPAAVPEWVERARAAGRYGKGAAQ